MIREEIRRGLTNRLALLGMAALYAGLVALSWKWLRNPYILLYVEGETMSRGSALYALRSFFVLDIWRAYPFLCALPLALTACDEWNGGYYRLQLCRTPWRRFVGKRLVAAAIAGGLVLALPLAAYLGTAVICDPYDQPYLQLSTELQHIFNPNAFVRDMSSPILVREYYPLLVDPEPLTWEQVAHLPREAFVRSELAIMGGSVVGAFVFGALWSLVALALSAWTTNRYLVLGLPAVLLGLLPGICVRLGWIALLPGLLMLTLMPLHYGWYFLTAAMEMALCGTLYCLGIRKRVRHG